MERPLTLQLSLSFLPWALPGVRRGVPGVCVQVQYLCLIATINLNPPAGWVYKLIQIYNLAIFDVVCNRKEKEVSSWWMTPKL